MFVSTPAYQHALRTSFRVKYGQIIIVPMKFNILLDVRRSSIRKFLRV